MRLGEKPAGRENIHPEPPEADSSSHRDRAPYELLANRKWATGFACG